jgi:hypothetical protein
MNASSGWQWAAIEVSSTASQSILASSFGTSSFVDSQGLAVDSNLEGIPTLFPGKSAWVATTIHNLKPVSRAFLSPQFGYQMSKIPASQFPTISEGTFTRSGTGGMVSAKITNNSKDKFLGGTTDIVFFNSLGVPIYAYWGGLASSIAPGFTSTVDLPANGSALNFVPEGYAKILVYLHTSLCDSTASTSKCDW